ncbi:MAG TPA: alpha/beta fold hydrolase [Nitrospirota bacterium]|nr:alpha/beta fold hydrolase [Nitrospirota bacterium]
MPPSRPAYRQKQFSLLFFLLFALLSLNGCDYVGFYTQQAHRHQTYRYFPSVAALNQIDPENSMILRGPIKRLQKQNEPLLLVAVCSKYQQNEKVDLVQIPVSTDTYMAFLPVGSYDLYVFADLDGDGDFESEELVGKASVIVNPEQSRNRAIIEGPAIIVDREHPGEVAFRVHEKVRPTTYVYASLDDEFFDPRYGNTGLYNPSQLIEHTQGFVFGLENFDAKKTTVLFVHGISGTPRDWKYLVAGMDRSRFQPLFFYYPSGLRLDTMGSLLAEVIRDIDKNAKEGGRRIVLVGYSMGGLVALSAINKLSEGMFPSSLKMFCSFSTPYGGDENAEKGVENAPVVVPVWRDIATKSEFLQTLTGKPFPKQLPYYLFFSYHETSRFNLGESSDGTIMLRSQLTPYAQKSATKIMGFDETHTGILNNDGVRQSFNQLLDTITAAP